MSAGQSHYSKLIQAVVSVLGLVLLLVWMQGGFTAKTPPGTAQAAESAPPLHGARAKAVLQEIDDLMLWPATVTARTVAQISSKVSARILAINVNAGDVVRADQPVVRLDPTELQAKVSQARSALQAAEAKAAQAHSEYRRVQSLYQQEAATQQMLEAAQAAAHAGTAQVAEARAAIATVESLLDETVLRTPFEGAVIKRNLEPGDMALPGVPILTLQSGQRLRVEAAIPETCANKIHWGNTLQARIGDRPVLVKVEEITPAADPKTHTVLVKAGLENPGFAKPGVFAWLEQNCQSRQALLIPAAAVSRSGQLESVRLVQGNKAALRLIRTGKARDGFVEVLSGLQAGDEVLLGTAP